MSNKLRYASPVKRLSKINLLCKQKSSRIIRNILFAKLLKVLLKCLFFLIAEFKRAAKIMKIAVYRFLISIPVPNYKGLKMSSLRSKSARKSCRNQSKSIKFVKSDHLVKKRKISS